MRGPRALLTCVAATMVVSASLSGPAVSAPSRPGTAEAPVPPAAPCQPGRAPFADMAGAVLSPEVRTSKDATPVRYVRWRGTVPSFDGLPLSVDVAVPCAGQGGADPSKPLPSVTVLHGFTDDKTVWEETDHSDTVESVGRPGSNSRWNDIWFASRGYVTLTYTARGWHDSCGPDTPGASPGTVTPQCASRQYWIHLDDKRWEVRDAQWLTGGLVSSGIADPKRLAITGGSYGGAPTASAALLDDRTMCGADPMPAALGPDPCTGKADGALVPWATPDRQTRLHWAAAIPLYTFADLLQVLAPNGRGSDEVAGAPPNRSHTDPFGVPLASTISGLVLAGQVYGTFAPKGSDPDSDILTTTNRLLAGDPYPLDEPVVADGIRVYERFKSPVTTDPQGRVPIFWVQGMTDALFPGSEALTMLRHVREADPTYPIKVFLGDIGHDYAAERQDDWKLVKAQMNAFLDHYLRPDRTHAAPTFDVGVSVTRCLDPEAPQRYLHARTWDALATSSVSFSSSTGGSTSTAEAGPAGAATDPISTATLPGPESYKGCRVMRPSKPDSTTVTARFPVTRDLTLLGGPVVTIRFRSSGPDAPLAVRVWDVAADGSAQGLVTRGVYRVDGQPVGLATARFQLAPQAYRFAKGHRLKVEVTANDSPYLLANEQPATVRVARISLALPLHVSGSPSASAGADADGDDAPQRSSTPIVLLALAAIVGSTLMRFAARRAAARRRSGR